VKYLSIQEADLTISFHERKASSVRERDRLFRRFYLLLLIAFHHRSGQNI